jgi:hypothetical protein
MLRSNRPYDIPSKLLHEIVDGINDRLGAGIKKATTRGKIEHSLNLTNVEAMALHCWYHQLELPEDQENYRYETIIARQIVAQIDQEFA